MVRGFQVKRSPKRACLKLDLQKAFDSVNRSFVLHVMRCIGFPEQWIKECIFTPSFSVLINGSPNGMIKSNRGLRQGDPLSPYLFSLVMEAFTLSLESGLRCRRWETFSMEGCPVVSHLLFADDILLFLKPTRRSITFLFHLIEDFGNESGLHINKSKSAIFFAKSVTSGLLLARAVQITVGKLPIKYLGLPLFASSKRSSLFDPLIEKFRSKVAFWNAGTISRGNRLELLRSVLQSYLYFWCSAFSLPIVVQVALDRIMRHFLWGTSSHHVNWATVCTPTGEGGLGIRRSEDVCSASLMRLGWQLLKDPTCLWSSWMLQRYCRGESF